MDENHGTTQDEDIKVDLTNLRNKLNPYRNIILAVCYIMLILIVGFVGFAFGAQHICNQVTGFLDDQFSCHLDYDVYGNPKNKTTEDTPILTPGQMPIILEIPKQ